MENCKFNIWMQILYIKEKGEKKKKQLLSILAIHIWRYSFDKKKYKNSKSK